MGLLPDDPIQRRRVTAVTALGVTALIVIVAIATAALGGGDSEPTRTAPEPEARKKPAKPRELTLGQQVGQLIVMSYDGDAPPAFVRQRLRDRQGAGVILFSKNVTGEDQLTQTTDALQKAGAGGALVAVDQEGGDTRSVPFVGPETTQGSLADEDAASTAATDAAGPLRDAGVNVDLGPVADVASDGSGLFAGRAFPGDAAQVSDLVAASVRGLDQAKVGSAVKHFPGLGDATINTDDAAVTISTPREQLESEDLAPFKAAIAADVPMVMVSHASYPALDEQSIASQSRPIVGGLLRRRLGFKGVAVTDSIEAQAVLDRGTVGEAAADSVEAGVDLVLTTGSGSWNDIYPELLKRAKSDPAFRARVKTSSDRVLALKRRLGLRVPVPE